MNWKQLKGIVRRRWGRLAVDYAGVMAGKRQQQADAKQLADWLAREHKADPIHK